MGVRRGMKGQDWGLFRGNGGNGKEREEHTRVPPCLASPSLRVHPCLFNVSLVFTILLFLFF